MVYVRLETSLIGPLLIAATRRGLCAIEFGADALSRLRLGEWSKKHFADKRPAEVSLSHPYVNAAATQLTEYLNGRRRDFDLPLDLRGTSFQLQVWKELRGIPYGTVTSYKAVAEQIGNPKAVRAVGGANNRNPLPVVVPCHRVIGSGGSLVGYGGGLDIKKSLLRLEGISGYMR